MPALIAAASLCFSHHARAVSPAELGSRAVTYRSSMPGASVCQLGFVPTTSAGKSPRKRTTERPINRFSRVTVLVFPYFITSLPRSLSSLVRHSRHVAWRLRVSTQRLHLGQTTSPARTQEVLARPLSHPASPPFPCATHLATQSAFRSRANVRPPRATHRRISLSPFRFSRFSRTAGHSSSRRKTSRPPTPDSNSSPAPP